MKYRLEIGGTAGRIIGIIKGATFVAIGVILILIGYASDWADGLQMWQMWIVGLVAAVCAFSGIYTVFAALTNDNFETTIGNAGS